MDSWVTRAARENVKRKADAISDAACTLADLLNREVSQDEMIAAALREAINQCQTGQGYIFAADLLSIAKHLAARSPDSPRENI